MKAFKLRLVTNISAAVKPIKVAIIDTGIDALHPSIRDECHWIPGGTGEKRIRDYAQWVENPKVEDVSGHGTHIAGIILNMTQNVELYIGRFTELGKPNEADKDKVRGRIIKVSRPTHLARGPG